jgi:alpha-tubulin suppressor-like RCC1 family protein
MATLNFPDDPTTGDVYTDSNSGFTYEWNGTVWISKDPSTVSNIREIDDISSDFDGSDTTFTLKVAGVNVEPANVQQLIISVGGVMQNAGQDFTVSGSTLTFTTAPSSSLTFFGVLLGTALSLNTVADGSVSPGSLTTTSNYLMGGLTVDQAAGIVTAFKFKGDGSLLTGVASTDNIVTSTDAYFGANVSIGGSLTVQGTETIINVEELNVQDKTVGIASTNAPTSLTQDGAGAIIYGQTHVDILYDIDKAALGISTAVNVAGFITATRAQVGTGVTINNTGIDIGIGGVGVVTTGTVVATSATVGSGVTINNTGIDAGIGAGIITASTYYGSGANLTGVGVTATIIGSSPLKDSQSYSAVDPFDQISFNVNQGIKAGNADKEIELRHGSVTGNVLQSFGVGSSVTYSFGQALVQPAAGIGITNEETYFVVVPDGAFETVGGASSTGVINDFSFEAKPFSYKRWSWGRNLQNVFGHGDGSLLNGYYSSPVQVGTARWSDIVLSGYGYNGLARRTDGSLYAWGQNAGGRLGQNNTTAQSSPKQIGTDTTWGRKFSCANSCAAIKTDGTLWMWGPNQYGEIGQNDRTNYSSPKQVGTETTWSTVSVGQGERNLTVAVKTDGTMWSWGRSTVGGLGQNSPHSGGDVDFSSPTQIGTLTTWTSAKVANTGNVYASKAITDAPTRFMGKKGELWVWGDNNYGQLGLSDKTQRSSPCQLPGQDYDMVNSNMGGGSNYQMCFTKAGGNMMCVGRNNSGGALGQNNQTEYSSPRLVGTDSDWTPSGVVGANYANFATKTDGTLWVWGRNYTGLMGQNHPTSPGEVGLSSPTQLEIPGIWNTISGSYYTFMGANQEVQ